MKYSIQNAFGDVYGLFEMPPNNQSPEVWVSELQDELSDILGINGVAVGLLEKRQGGEPRIVIDIEPLSDDEEQEKRLATVHATVGSLATLHKPNFE